MTGKRCSFDGIIKSLWKNIVKDLECFFAVACGQKLNDLDIKINRLTIVVYSRENVRNWRQEILVKILGMLRKCSSKSKSGGNFSVGPKINHGRQ